MVLSADVVAQEKRGVVIHGNQDINCAVVVEISDGEATSGKRFREDGTALGADVGPGFAGVVKQQEWLAVADLVMGEFFNQIVRVAIGEEKIEVAVVVIVEELEAPAAHQAGGGADTGGEGLVVEGLVVIVLIERIHLVVDVGDEQVHPAVLIDVRGVEPHAGARPAFGAVGDPGLGSNLLETAVATVGEEEVGDRVVGDKEVHAAVVVDVGGNHAPSLAEIVADSR